MAGYRSDSRRRRLDWNSRMRPASDGELVGTFIDGPVIGLGYLTPSRSGLTDDQGRFSYRAGETVEFSLGELVLGTAQGASQVTSASFESQSGGDGVAELTHPVVTNVARLLQSLSNEPDVRNGIVVTDVVRDAVRSAGPIEFGLPEAEFAAQPSVRSLLNTLGLTLRPASTVRNHLRRSITGIKKLTDVHVPTRDGSYLLADLLRPIAARRFPALLRMSIYGRNFPTGSLSSELDRERSEDGEDAWFEGRNPDGPEMYRYAENGAGPKSADWVPRGYVLVRLDPRGVGRTPGRLAPFSMQEAEDYFDAIEWAAEQPWCTGAVGLLGLSYAATTQWNVAALSPPSLRAMIPWAGDADAYRDLSYPGGILNEGYRDAWWSFVKSLQSEPPAVDFVEELRRHPFDDPAFYGPHSSGPLSPNLEDIAVPFLTSVSQTGAIHARAGIEAAVAAKVPNQLVVVPESYQSFFYDECLDLQFHFFDWYLKGIGEGVPGPPVRLMMRTGGGEYFWRDELEWPVRGTDLQAWHLDGGSPWSGPVPAGPERMYGMDASPAQEGASLTYSAEMVTPADYDCSGIRFVGAPLAADLHLAGHFKADLWVSSTAHDMDVFVALRVTDSNGDEIRYPVKDDTSDTPLTWGCLKVSHRKTDPTRSQHRPWHTHLESDVQPLRSASEVVPIEVELMPATAVVRVGQRLILDVQPVEGRGGPIGPDAARVNRAYDPSYHTGAENTLYTGGSRPSRLWLPVIPPA